LLKSIKNHFLRALKVGFAVFIPLAVIMFVLNIALGFIFQMGEIFTANKTISFAVFIFFIYVLGLLFSKTNIMSGLKKNLKSHPFILRILNIFPDKNKKESERKGDEVLYYFSKTVRIRGEAVHEFTDEDGISWVVVHPHSPPIPKTGAVLFEVRKDDPKLVFTGRPFAYLAAYTMSYGASLSSEEKSLSPKEIQTEEIQKLGGEISSVETEKDDTGKSIVYEF